MSELGEQVHQAFSWLIMATLINLPWTILALTVVSQGSGAPLVPYFLIFQGVCLGGVFLLGFLAPS